MVEEKRQDNMTNSRWVQKLTGGYILDSDIICSDQSWDIMLIDESSIKLDLMYGETSFNHDNGRDTRATHWNHSNFKDSNLKTPKTQADNRSDMNSTD